MLGWRRRPYDKYDAKAMEIIRTCRRQRWKWKGIMLLMVIPTVVILVALVLTVRQYGLWFLLALMIVPSLELGFFGRRIAALGRWESDQLRLLERLRTVEEMRAAPPLPLQKSGQKES